MKLFKKTDVKKADLKNVESMEKMSIPPKFYPIDVDDLRLADYQRGLRKQKSKYYADHYDPDIFGVILVSRRDDQYWILDGQHRVETCKILGVKTVLCQVIENLTYEQEAEKFYKINTCRVPLNANHKFNALVEEKNTAALDIVRALNKYGFTFSKEGVSVEDNCIIAVGTLQRIYKYQGYVGLCDVLEIIRKAWNGERASLRAEMMKGINTFITNYRCDKYFLIKALETYTPMGIIYKARGNTNSSTIGTRTDGTCFHIAKTIRDIYDEFAIKNKRDVCVYVVR